MKDFHEMRITRYLLALLLSVGISTGVQAQNKTIRELSDLTPVVGDALETETAANASGHVLVSELLALITPTTFPDPVNTSCELAMFDFTGSVLGFIGTDAAGPICINTAGNVSFSNITSRHTVSGITASTTQTQGNGQLTGEINEIAIVANTDDTITLPSAVKGYPVTIINNGANTLQMFPFSGDNLGAGVDVSEMLEANESIIFIAFDSDNWHVAATTEISHAEVHTEDSTTAYVINDAGADFHSYHSADFTAGDLAGWTFDAGGAGTSFPIASVADSAGSPGSQILVTTTGSHLLAVGDIISHTNLADAAYVGVFKVVATAAATTYEVAAVFTATGTGTMDQAATITCDVGFGGAYYISYTSSATTVSNNETFDFRMFDDTVRVTGSSAREKFGTGADFSSYAGQALVTVSDGDKISFALSNENSAGNITVRNLTIILIRL